MIVLNFASLLTSHNVQAAIRALRLGESWNDRIDRERDEMAWRVRYHPTRYPTFFDSFDQHPRIFEPLPDGSNRRSSAAGALQITATTWDDIRARYEGVGPEFTPYQQMCAGVALMHMEGALDDVVDGKFDVWLPKLAKRWASMPNSPLSDGGRKRSYAEVRAEYAAWGGSFYEDVYVIPPETQPPAPIEERGQPARPEDVERINQQEEAPMGFTLIGELIQGLIQLFAPVARAQATKWLDKTTGNTQVSQEFADKLLSLAQQAAAQAMPGIVPPPVSPAAPAPPAASAIDPVVAVGIVKANPALVAQVEREFVNWLEQMAPVLDRLERLDQAAWQASEQSFDAARKAFASDPTSGQDRLLTLAIIGLQLLAIAGLSAGLVLLIVFKSPYGDVLTLLATGLGVIWTKFSTRYDHRYGSSRSSAAKDTVIEELSVQRRNRNG